jgi:hypothetical protein
MYEMKGILFFQGIVWIAILASQNEPAQAAQLQSHLQYETSYKADFSPAPYTLADGMAALPPGTVAPDDIHQLYAS